MRVMGRALGQGSGAAYDAYLLQVDGGPIYVATAAGEQLVVRSALTGEIPDDQDITMQVRTEIALHNARDAAVTAEQDEGGAWSAQAVLAPGVVAFGSGVSRQAAIDECNDRLGLLVDELRASA